MKRTPDSIPANNATFMFADDTKELFTAKYFNARCIEDLETFFQYAFLNGFPMGESYEENQTQWSEAERAGIVSVYNTLKTAYKIIAKYNWNDNVIMLPDEVKLMDEMFTDTADKVEYLEQIFMTTVLGSEVEWVEDVKYRFYWNYRLMKRVINGYNNPKQRDLLYRGK